MKKLVLIFLTSILLFASNDMVVVTNTSVVEKLSKSEVKRLFLSKTNKVHNINIKVVELSENGEKDKFYKQISGKSKSQLRSYWTRLIFTGKARPPKQVNNMQELLKEMKKSEVIVTYLPKNKVTKQMKIVYTLND